MDRIASPPGYERASPVALARRASQAPALVLLLINASVTSLVAAGEVAWMASLLIRTRHMSLSGAGVVLAFGFGVAGAGGVICGGWIVDRLGRGDARRRVWFLASAMVVSLISLNVFLGTRGPLSIAGLVVWGVASSTIYGPTLALLHELAGSRLYGLVSAAYYLFTTVGGAALGPVAVGLISDGLQPSFGSSSLTPALQLLSGLYVLTAVIFALCGVTLRRDIAQSETWGSAPSASACRRR